MRKLFIFIFLLASMSSNASVETFATIHSETKALDATSDFIRTVFIENNIEKAYESTYKVMKSKISLDKFKKITDSVDKINERYEITHVLVNRQKNQVSVYFDQIGKNNEKVYFGVMLVGSSIVGYQVA